MKKIAENSIKRKTITIFLSCLMMLAGIFAYMNLGRYEDPEYTIKKVVVSAVYPGATPKEVEQQVTDVLETAIQSMGEIDEINSVSYPEFSLIYAETKDKYMADDLPQIWDKVRRKVHDCAHLLPKGVMPAVNDDFGDVYGMFFAVTGDGYSYREIKDYVDYLKKEILLIPGVAKIAVWGMPQEKIYINISKAMQLGISKKQIFNIIRNQDTISRAGDVDVDNENIRIFTTGRFQSIDEIGDIIISDVRTGKNFRLRDIATIKRDYDDSPSQIMRFNGKEGIAFGISNAEGENVVKLGGKVQKKLNELKHTKPTGMEINSIYFQPERVTEAIDGFLVNLIEAIVIVVGILMIFMGLRSGLLIGGMLFMIICGTFLVMSIMHVDLHRISLGALIIALGMLVDNAIVIADGALVRMQQGMSKLDACVEVVGQTAMPLLGATVIAIMAFAGIGFSPDSMGEYCHALYDVILISLSLSWVLAITVMPFLCYHFLKVKNTSVDEDIYDKPIYNKFKKILSVLIAHRWKTIAVTAVTLFVALWGFGQIPPSFFPTSGAPYVTVDYWLPEGTKIQKTSTDLKQIEQWVKKQPEIESFSTYVGAGPIRYMLVYDPEDPNTAYGYMMLKFKPNADMDAFIKRCNKYIASNYLDANIKVSRFIFGIPADGKIELRIIGKDDKLLRSFAHKVKTVVQKNPNATYIRNDWRQKVKVLKPVFSQSKARKVGVSRADMNLALDEAFSGVNTGVYYEGNIALPIVAQLPEKEADSVEDIKGVQVWSSVKNRMIPLEQVIDGVQVEMQNSLIKRKDRYRVMQLSFNPVGGYPAEVLRQYLKSELDKMEIPDGIKLEWGGDFENSRDSQAGVNKSMPVWFLLMFTILVFLFNGLRQPLIIFACIPLSLIGLTIGLFLTHTSFEFMAFLAFFGLIGMLIKNAIVLIDQIELEKSQGKEPYDAIVDSAISRTRPVMMAALTTVLGVVPLMWDLFFKALAVTIIFGLTFATVLTLCVVPVLYATVFGVHKK